MCSVWQRRSPLPAESTPDLQRPKTRANSSPKHLCDIHRCLQITPSLPFNFLQVHRQQQMTPISQPACPSYETSLIRDAEDRKVLIIHHLMTEAQPLNWVKSKNYSLLEANLGVAPQQESTKGKTAQKTLRHTACHGAPRGDAPVKILGSHSYNSFVVYGAFLPRHRSGEVMDLQRVAAGACWAVKTCWRTPHTSLIKFSETVALVSGPLRTHSDHRPAARDAGTWP